MKHPSRSRTEEKPETPRPGADQILVVFNPKARSERASGLREQIQALDPRVTLRATGGPGDAAAIAAQAVEQGYKTVVAAGGDGTINEVVNGLAGSNVHLGLLPLGTMNVFAAELGIPGNRLKRSWEIIRAGHLRRVDVAQANRHCFVQLAGVGFDAQAVAGSGLGGEEKFRPVELRHLGGEGRGAQAAGVDGRKRARGRPAGVVRARGERPLSTARRWPFSSRR